MPKIPLALIDVPQGRRRTDSKAVAKLTDSIKTIGLRIPIAVMPQGQRYELVTGRHRLEAHHKLGRDDIEAQVFTDPIEAQLWEIAENLHRSELTAMQRSVAEAQWIKLTEKMQRVISSQLETKLPRNDAGRPESGINAASRKLGISKARAHRSIRIAKLKPSAQKRAEALGFDDNQKALTTAACYDTAADQIKSLERQAEIRDRRDAERRMPRETLVHYDEGGTFAKSQFLTWYRSLDNGMQRVIRKWLQGLDAPALADELEKPQQQEPRTHLLH